MLTSVIAQIDFLEVNEFLCQHDSSSNPLLLLNPMAVIYFPRRAQRAVTISG